MRIESYKFPKSSFLSINKDLDLIINRILENERLQKLLFYTTNNPLKFPSLTEDQQLELMSKNIKIVPKLTIDGTVLNYIIVGFDNFITNGTNPEFRDNIISFDIICHFDQWQLDDFNLRPYRIAAELDFLFNNTHLTGIGTLQFLGCNQILINEEFGGISLNYAAIHGEEDKKGMLNPQENAQFIKDFNSQYN